MKGMLIAGLEAEFSKKEEEWSLERKQLQQQLEELKAQLISQLETRDVERNQQLAALETQNLQLANLNRELEGKILKLAADQEQEQAKNKRQIAKLTEQLEEMTTLLQGQSQQLSGLLKQHFLVYCWFGVF